MAVFAEALLGEGVFAAGLGILGHHVGIAESNDDHHHRAQDHGNGGVCHTGIGLKLLAGIHKGAPADDAAKSIGPHIGRIEGLFQSLIVLFIMSPRLGMSQLLHANLDFIIAHTATAHPLRLSATVCIQVRQFTKNNTCLKCCICHSRNF